MFNDRLRQAPFFRLFCPLAAGIVLRQCAEVSHTVVIILSFSVLAVTLITYLSCSSTSSLMDIRIFGLLANICLLCLGGSLSVPLCPVPVKPSRMIATVSVAPVEREKTCKLILSQVCLLDDSTRIPGKVLAYLGNQDHENTPLPGNKILLFTDLKPVPEPANPFDFNYRKYYFRKQIMYQVYVPSNRWMLIDNEVPADIRYIIESYRYRIGEKIIELFPRQEESGMLIALYLGNNAYLGQEEKSSFSRAGALHFLAVSGLHTAIVFYFLQLILRLIPGARKTRILRTVLIISLLWGYALLTGLTGSVTRACLMLSLWQVAVLARRASCAFNILFFSAVIILTVSPDMLYDVGFQLSYLAVAGILLFLPHASKSISKTGWLTGKILSLVIISASAQVATLPASIYYFHQISHYFILTNLLISPLIAMLLYTAPLLLFSNFITCINLPVASLVSFITRCTLRIIDFINRIPGSYSDGYYPEFVQVGLLYIIILSAYLYFFMKRRKFILSIMISILLYLLIDTTRELSCEKQMQFFVYHLRGTSAVNIVSGGENILIAGTDPAGSREWQALQQFWDKLGAGEPYILKIPDDSTYISDDCFIWISPGTMDGFTFIQVHDVRIGITSEPVHPEGKGYKFPRLDCLVIQNNCFPDSHDLIHSLPAATIIPDGSNSSFYAKKRTDEYRSLGLDVHNTAEEGCFRLIIPPSAERSIH